MEASSMAGAAASASSSSTKQRIALFRGSLTSMIDCSDDISDVASALVEVVFSTLHTYNDRPSRLAVELVITKALKQAAFVKQFAGTLVQTAEKNLKVATGAVLLKLLTWSCLVVRHSPEVVSSKTAFSRLASVQSCLLASLPQGRHSLRASARRTFFRTVQEVDGLYDAYLLELESLAPEKAAGLISFLLEYSVDRTAFEKKGLFLDLYIKIVLGSREKPPRALSESFQTLFKQLSHDDFGKLIAPAAVRMLKRNPELVLEAVAILLKQIQLDLSRYISEFVPVVLLQARHAEDSRRREAALIVSYIAQQSGDQECLSSLFQSIKSILEGSEGKLAFVYQRVGMVNTIYALCSAARGKALVSLASSISSFLFATYKEDANEELRLSVLPALGSWLARTDDKTPKDSSRFFVSGLKEKETLRRAHLRCLRQAFTNEELPMHMLELVDPLIQLSKAGITKPAQRLDGIYSLLFLLKISLADVTADDKVIREKIVLLALQKDSAFWSHNLTKLQVEDCIALGELLELILQHESARKSECSDGLLEALRLLVSLLWHPMWDVRKATAGVVRRLQAASASLSEALFAAFRAWIPLLEDQLRLASKGNTDDTTGDVLSENLLSKALKSLGCSHLLKDPNMCTQFLILYHHECVSRGVFWKDFVKHFNTEGLDIIGVLKSSPASVCKVLAGSYGLDCEHWSISQASILAFGTVMRSLPDEVFPPLLQTVDDLTDWSSHDGLSENDILVFNTPEGMLSKEGGVYVSEVVADKNIRQAKGRFKMYDSSDNVNRSSGKDSNKSSRKTADPKSAKEEARELLLKEEANIRSKVQLITERFRILLRLVSVVASANPDYVQNHLPVLTGPVFRLLKSPIVSEEAYQTMTTLTKCLAPSLKNVSLDIAAALRIVATATSFISIKPDLSDEEGVIGRVVSGMAKACTQEPLPTHSFEVVFPVLEKVLLLPSRTVFHDDLLHVMSLHCSPLMRVPRQKMALILYHVLGLLPSYQSAISAMLTELCRGMQARDIPEALSGVYSDHAHVRATCLTSACAIPILAKRAAPQNPVVATALWISMHDTQKDNADLAEEAWDLYNHDLGNDYAAGLLGALSHIHLNVREAAAAAIAAAMDDYPSTIQETLTALFSLYARDLPSSATQDPGWPGRQGVALALKAAADFLTTKDLAVVSTFLISRALADTNPDVRSKMVVAGIAVIDKHGKDSVAILLPIFENYLNKKSVVDEEKYDMVREGVVVFMGALAKHLSGDDPKVSVILERLLEALKTPSEAVQRAVSNCLPPLMAMEQVNVESLIKRLLDQVVQADKFGDRYGAAFGLAGAVKGVGISALKKFGVMDALILGVQDKNSAKAREGALLSFDCLSEKLGRLFEPYVIRILPELLVCFSDPVLAVRDATDRAARTIMSQLSGQGVKLILPALLKGLGDKAWRTKQGSVQLLGAMAFCAPKMLSQCLPTIVPKLSAVLTDTHPKVQSAAQTSLQQVGSVIKNPEILALVPLLLIGIANPDQHTKSSLDALLQTTFVNTVDAPSLALIVPIVHRGLRERSAETKKKAAQIVGNMCSLVTDYKDMLPYLSLLLPEVKKVLVDPIPEVRTVAAKALGSLLQGMGDGNFQDLVPWLLETLKSENSSVERSGAAQGLSEVLAALGTDYFEQLLPEIIQNCSHIKAAVRDGYLTLFKYLPVALGRTFQNYLPRVLPAILDGLADENESVRDAALSAGHVFVEHYAASSLPLLLPVVEEGIFRDNWRIRQSSMELLGDLLFKVAGTSGKVVLEGGSDDEGASTEAQGRAIMEILGRKRRNEVLAALYMVRSDSTSSVRQAALHVWKTVVANTPKTLKEIMPVLMSTLIASLASTSSERRQVAGRSLGELVRKLGDRVLPLIIPILSQGLQDENGGTRQGVCMGLSEVMASAGKLQLMTYMSDLIPTIRTALCDSVPEVREAAGIAFGTMFKSAGMQAIDEIVPSLLGALETSPTALDGLKQILSVRTSAVLPHILPKLVQPPLTAFNAHALGALAEVAGAGLNLHLSTVLPPLISAMGENDKEISNLARSAAETVILVVDVEGSDALLSELLRSLNDAQASVRIGAAYLLGFLWKNVKLDLSDEVPNLISTLIIMLTDNNEEVLKASWEALSSVVGTISKENQPSYVKVVRDSVSSARDKERRKRKAGPVCIPGFCLPKGLQPVLPIFLQGLMSGSAEVREQAAEGLGELINVTNEAALRPFVVPITGPLIRIIGDRYPWQVKSAILATLGIIISKGGIALKPFLPQLQTTFVKCLQDTTRIVRSRAASALGKLSGLSTRVDPLVGDLVTGILTAEGGVKEAMLVALKGVVRHAGKGLSPAVTERIGASLQDLLLDDDDRIRVLAARTLGLTSQYVGEESFLQMLQYVLTPGTSWTSRHGFTLALTAMLKHAPSRVSGNSSLYSATMGVLKARAKDDKATIRESSARAFGRLFVHELRSQASDSSRALSELLPAFTALLSDASSDVKRAALSSLKSVAKVDAEALMPHLTSLGPAVGDCVKDSSSPVRLAAERCSYYLFQLNKGSDTQQLAQRFLTGLDTRRIAKQPSQSDTSDGSDDEF